MNIEKGTETLDKADGFLTKLKNILKNHWGILLLILIGFGVYKFIVTVGHEMDKQAKNPTDTVDETSKDNKISETTEGHKGVQQHQSKEVNYYITKETYFIDKSGYRLGDTVYVDYYNDGYIEEYYTDGEAYYKD